MNHLNLSSQCDCFLGKLINREVLSSMEIGLGNTWPLMDNHESYVLCFGY